MAKRSTLDYTSQDLSGIISYDISDKPNSKFYKCVK
jgi:hypothetical protein